MTLRQAAGTSKGSTRVWFGTEENRPANVCWSPFSLFQLDDFVQSGKNSDESKQ